MASKMEECEAFEKLRAFVARTLPSAQLRWKDGAEPPDFDLFVDEIEYAVEVTQLRKLFQVGQARLPMRAIGRDLEAFVRRAEVALVASGELVGSFAVVMPRPIPDLRSREPELIELIRKGVQELQFAPLQAKTLLLRVDRRQCSLLKLAEQGCSLRLYGPTDAQWNHDSKIEIQSLIDGHITVKAAKLREISVPRLLVLHDKHVYSEREHFLESTKQVPASDSFHTIFVARGDREDWTYPEKVDAYVIRTTRPAATALRTRRG